jgi:hypothetical protein
MPMIGDNDSGRFLRLEQAGSNDTYRVFLCGIGSALFHDNGLLPYAYQDSDSLVARLLFDECDEIKKGKKEEPSSVAFKDSGFYIMKNRNMYSFINCSPIGTEGRGAHSHNDRLSVLLYVKGEDIIIDPGVYAYTASMEIRDRYRNVEAHATVCINGKQPNRLNPPGCWWGYLDDTRCQCLNWDASSDKSFFEGEHYAYCRLDIPVIHNRQVESNENMLEICDQFIKAEEFGNDMTVDYHFMLGPSCRVSIEGQHAEITSNHVNVTATTKLGRWSQSKGWYAPKYGVEEETTALHIHFDKFIDHNELVFAW